MEELELVSVIMPAYNAAKFIAESINSVIAQTYSHWELIIVDDGSEDDLKSIVEKFAEKDSRIKYVHQLNGKQGKARNTGIENSEGELVAFIDADDIWKPQLLEEQTALITGTGADLVFSNIMIIDKEGNITDEHRFVSAENLAGINGIKSLLQKNIIAITTVLAKKGAIIKAGGFKILNELQYAEDYDLWLRMLANGNRFRCNQSVLALYRKHEKQSTKLLQSKYLQILEIIKNFPVDKSLQKEKDDITYLWLRRSLQVSKNLEHKNYRKLVQFIPSFFFRKLSLYASYVMPMYLLRRMTFQLSFLYKNKF
jgi:teichuronic acid biosynthesis glycosyltransferase TuaG